MARYTAGKHVQAQLQKALDGDLLPDHVQDAAADLLYHLQQPVRLSILGMRESGKSTLLNLLVGANVLQDDASLPTLQLSYGKELQTVCTLPDGSKETLNSVDGQEIAALSPVFVKMQMPLPALTKISVLEVVAPDDPTSLLRASRWAAKRSDIALWCTQKFGTVEQQVWAQMPDQIKDQALLLMTQADVLSASGMYDAALSGIHAVASDEFHQILPLATVAAIAARGPDGTVDRDMLRKSGGMALIQAVLKQVEAKRQPIIEAAELLLRQHVQAPQIVEPPSPAVQEAEPEPPQEPRIILQPAPAPVQKEKPAPPPVPDTSDLHPETRAAYAHVVTAITQQAQDLSLTLNDLGDGAPSQIMTMTVEHIQWLSDYLNENGDDNDDALQRARDSAFDAADLVQLMQMEKRDSAALEAVKLMLQIKRELQADLAA